MRSNFDLNKHIWQAFASRWVGESVTRDLDSMKAQLYKSLKDQTNGCWSGHTAYHIMVDYGFIVDKKHVNGEPKKLTKLGEFFIKEYEWLNPPNKKEEIDSDTLSSLLSLVSLEVSETEIEAWSSEQKELAREYASAVHLDASDNDCEVPEKPSFLPEPKLCTGLWD